MEGIKELKITLYCCPLCPETKEYKSKFNLKKHMQSSHFSKNEFKCVKCEKKFVSKQNLREHMFIHTGQKPFKCSYCGKKFRQTSQLCMHRRVHNKKYSETLKIAKLIEQEIVYS